MTVFIQLFELHNFIYMTLERMTADSIHLIGCGFNAVSADSIHNINNINNLYTIFTIIDTAC